MDEYPRYLKPGFEPYDPIQLATMTEGLVCQNSSRKYTAFYCTGVYGGRCLRCVFCWVDLSRDFPEEYGQLYTPVEVFERLVKNAKKRGVSKLRVSGGEPTLGKEHLLTLLELVEETDYLFILETNGVLIGSDAGYAHQSTRYTKIHTRVSLKAGMAEGFEKRTGTKGGVWELPCEAISRLGEAKVSFHAAAMSDRCLTPSSERADMLCRLKESGYEGYLEEEVCDPYRTSIAGLREAGFELF